MKFMVLFDIHIGYRWYYSSLRGRYYRVPTHDTRALGVVFNFASRFSPDCVILGGDQLSMNEVSPYARKGTRSLQGLKLIENYQKLEELVIRPIEDLGPDIKVWIDGNHEDWLYQFIEQEPGLEGILTPPEYLRLRDRGWIVAGSNDLVEIGPYLAVCHGSAIRVGKYTAHRFSSVFRRNLRLGHYHRFEAASDVVPLDSSQYHTTIVVPSLCARNQGYTNGVPSNTVQGFLVGEMGPDGMFNDFVLVINNYRIIYNGFVYTDKGAVPIGDTRGLPKITVLEDRTYETKRREKAKRVRDRRSA
jgi:hypothetical protein